MQPSSGPKHKAEQRRGKRHYVNLVARLAQADGAELGSCVVADISGSGARLKTNEAASLPENFVLLLSINGRLRRHCLVAWRTNLEVGVEFVWDNPSEKK
jgi:hypothetical protein